MKPAFSVGGLGACNMVVQVSSEGERQVPKFDVCYMCFSTFKTSMMPGSGVSMTWPN